MDTQHQYVSKKHFRFRIGQMCLELLLIKYSPCYTLVGFQRMMSALINTETAVQHRGSQSAISAGLLVNNTLWLATLMATWFINLLQPEDLSPLLLGVYYGVFI